MRFRSQIFPRQVQLFKAEAMGVVLAVSFSWQCKANPVILIRLSHRAPGATFIYVDLFVTNESRAKHGLAKGLDIITLSSTTPALPGACK